MAINETLITAAEVASLLSVSASDPWLLFVVNRENVWATERRAFVRAERTEVVRGYGANTIFVRESPIAEIAEVRIDPLGAFGDSTVVDASQFYWNRNPADDSPQIVWQNVTPRAISLSGPWQYGVFPEGPGTVQLRYTAGYYPIADSSAPRMPEALRTALIENALEAYRLGAGKERMKTESIGGYSYTRADSEIPEKRRAIFRRYRIM